MAPPKETHPIGLSQKKDWSPRRWLCCKEGAIKHRPYGTKELDSFWLPRFENRGSNRFLSVTCPGSPAQAKSAFRMAPTRAITLSGLSASGISHPFHEGFVLRAVTHFLVEKQRIFLLFPLSPHPSENLSKGPPVHSATPNFEATYN